jgi:hypothetical protein
MCNPKAPAHTTVSASPILTPAWLCPARSTMPVRLKKTAATICHGTRTLKKARAASGAKTTKRPVMSPELVGVVYRRPSVWKR